MGFYVPWVVNGSKHSARLFRRTLQQQVGTGSGVSRPGDLKVQALNVPGTGFRVSPGGGVAQSRDTEFASRESYGPILDSELVVDPVPGTGSGSGRRDLVILEITDPEMESVTYDEPVDEAGWQDGGNFCRITVIPGVGAGVKSLDEITTGPYANVTGVTLAAINWPASTGTISGEMIEDLRVVQSPRTVDYQFGRPRVNADDGAQVYLTGEVSAGGEYFPGGAGFSNQFTVEVPVWASRMLIEPKWLSVEYAGGKDPRGEFWMEYGDEYRAHTWPNQQQYEFSTQRFAFNSPNSADVRTANWILMDNVQVPAKLRGKTVTFVFKAGLTNKASVGASAVWMKAYGGLGCSIKFSEDAKSWETVL